MSDDMVRRLETAHTQMQREMDRLRKQLDEAREENERVRLANLDCVAHYEDARAANAEMAAVLRAALAVSERHSSPTFNVISDCLRAALSQEPPASPSPVLRDAVMVCPVNDLQCRSIICGGVLGCQIERKDRT